MITMTTILIMTTMITMTTMPITRRTIMRTAMTPMTTITGQQ